MDEERGAGSTPTRLDFIRAIVSGHVAQRKYPQIHTRFPPEPNGYLHIGHAKSICLNYGIARQFGGICNLRLDDTNPTKENIEFVESIRADVAWLIDGWADAVQGLKPKGLSAAASRIDGKLDVHLPATLRSGQPTTAGGDPDLEPFYASDYFEHFYAFAQDLIKRGKAYVCDLSPRETDEYRGAPDRPGRNSPFRSRSETENLDLFTRMRAGEFPDGARTLRAKIDMASPNVWMRDPILYRIRHCHHHRTGDAWRIYPMYDFAHCLSDYIEGITHSICTLEFEVHRPLYDWILTSLDLPRPLPVQYEFSRLSLSHTVMSKRKLALLVKEGVVNGWDDPRMPTISGLRRRGITAAALRRFAQSVGITRYNGTVEAAVYAHAIREELGKIAIRRLVVLRPLKVTLTNFPDDQTEFIDAPDYPQACAAGRRRVAFSRDIYIERDDFQEHPEIGFKRLSPGGSVRLKYACVIRCDNVIKSADGTTSELQCSVLSLPSSGTRESTPAAQTAIHWVSARHAITAEIRLYDELFTVAEPDTADDFRRHLNPHSLVVVTAKCEPEVTNAIPSARYQFERLGYFALDRDSTPEHLVFNRTITLRDSWSRRRSTVREPAPVSPEVLDRVNPSPSAPGSSRVDEIVVKGRVVRIQGALVMGVPVVCRGKLARIAMIKDEWWQPRQLVDDPEALLSQLRNSRLNCDIFAFGQRPPDMAPKYGYPMEWENLAAIPLTSAAHWWQHQIGPDVRQNIRRARKAGVVVRVSSLDDSLVRGIWTIYNESPLRQGKPFYHYGIDLDAVRRRNSSYSDQTLFIGAYFDEELIGFLQLNRMGGIADVKQLLSKNAHYDKKPGNVLLAKAIEICTQSGMNCLVYGKFHYYGGSRSDSLLDFKRRHGFEELRVPRYYIPLTKRGAIMLKFGLHREGRMMIPEPLLRTLLEVRSRLYQSNLTQRILAIRSGNALRTDG